MPILRPQLVSKAEEDRDSFLDRGAFQPANSIEEPPDAIAASLYRVFEPEFSSGLVWPDENVFTHVFWLPGICGELFVGSGSFGSQGGSEVFIDPVLHGFDGDGGEALADFRRRPVS